MLSAIQLHEKRRHEMMQKKDFYKQGCCAPMRSRFQGRENKRDQLKELREQFQRDREKIQKMKENRKFNPVSSVCWKQVIGQSPSWSPSRWCRPARGTPDTGAS